jgi:formylglycine-generating enzyme required for sulfatase activity
MKTLFVTALLIMCAGEPVVAQTTARVFKDCADCPELVVVPAGSFWMGSKPDQPMNFRPPANERPIHLVTLKSFAIGKYEVTQEQWIAVMGHNPSEPKGMSLPVVNVSWNDVQHFIERLNNKTGQSYRLPSESEWEYATRAGSTTLYLFGDDASQLGTYAWFDRNSDGKLHPIGLKQVNKFGLHDVHGNVCEWVQDCGQANYVNAPDDGSAVESQGVCFRRVTRGGSFVDGPDDLRSARRDWGDPTKGYFGLGFRIAKTLP